MGLLLDGAPQLSDEGEDVEQSVLAVADILALGHCQDGSHLLTALQHALVGHSLHRLPVQLLAGRQGQFDHLPVEDHLLSLHDVGEVVHRLLDLHPDHIQGVINELVDDLGGAAHQVADHVNQGVIEGVFEIVADD